MMRAVTCMDSGLPLGGLPPSKTESLLTMDPFLSRREPLVDSGEDSPDSGGEGVATRVNEVARSATEGDRDGSRPAALRTAKNEAAGLSFGAGSALPPGMLESFSRALMRWEILDPSLLLFGRNSDEDCCWVILCRYAAPEETALAELAELAETSPGRTIGPLMGFDTVLTMRGMEDPLSEPGAASLPTEFLV